MAWSLREGLDAVPGWRRLAGRGSAEAPPPFKRSFARRPHNAATVTVPTQLQRYRRIVERAADEPDGSGEPSMSAGWVAAIVGALLVLAGLGGYLGWWLSLPESPPQVTAAPAPDAPAAAIAAAPLAETVRGATPAVPMPASKPVTVVMPVTPAPPAGPAPQDVTAAVPAAPMPMPAAALTTVPAVPLLQIPVPPPRPRLDLPASTVPLPPPRPREGGPWIRPSEVFWE